MTLICRTFYFLSRCRIGLSDVFFEFLREFIFFWGISFLVSIFIVIFLISHISFWMGKYHVIYLIIELFQLLLYRLIRNWSIYLFILFSILLTLLSFFINFLYSLMMRRSYLLFIIWYLFFLVHVFYLEWKKLKNVFNNQLRNKNEIVFKNLRIHFIMIIKVKLIYVWILDFLQFFKSKIVFLFEYLK